MQREIGGIDLEVYRGEPKREEEDGAEVKIEVSGKCEREVVPEDYASKMQLIETGPKVA